MPLHKVLERAFAGCGLDLQQVQSSPAWREHFDRFSFLAKQDPASSELAALFHAGPHQVGELLTRRTPSETVRLAAKATTAWPCDPYLQTAFCCLGDALIDSAVACLPASFDVDPKVYVYLDRLKLPLSLDELVACWQAGDAETRLQIAKLLAVTFAGCDNEDYSSEDDRANQPAERVLPGCFGRWGESSTANCLGKAIMVAAFGKLVGAEMIAVLPIQLSHRIYNCKRGEAASLCLQILSHLDPLVSAERMHSLEEIAAFGYVQDNEISWSHMAVALRLDAHHWVLIDPNMGMASVFPDCWEMNSAYDLLCNYGRALPGLSLLRQDQQIEEEFESYLDLCMQHCAQLIPFVDQLLAKTYTKEELVVILMQSDILDSVLTWQEFGPTELDPASSRDRKAICALLEHFYDPEKEPLPDGSPARKCLWFAFVGKRDDQWLLDQLNDGTAMEAMRNLCYKFAVYGITLMDRARMRDQGDADLHHPRCQLSAIGPGLAIAVLGHVAHAMGVSVEVEPKLCGGCFDLYRLLYTAGRLVLEPETAGPEAHQALAILRRLLRSAFLLPSAIKVLNVLGGLK